MQSSDPSHFFQSDAAHAKHALRSAKLAAFAGLGDPVTLSGKPLRVLVPRASSSDDATAWIAESGGIVTHVNLATGETKAVLRGHKAPVTCVALSIRNKDAQYLFSGSWDKTVKAWSTKTGECVATVPAHDDFVKALHVIDGLKVLISASSDKSIRIWDLDTFDGSGKAFQSCGSFRQHRRPIERLESYELRERPIGPDDDDDDDIDDSAFVGTGRHVLLSVDSMGSLITWELWRDEQSNRIHCELRTETRPHETAIYDLKVLDGEVWTASADHSVLKSSASPYDAHEAPKPVMRIPMPAHTKAVLPVHFGRPEAQHQSYLVAGSSDDLIRIIDTDEIDAAASVRQPFSGQPVLQVDGLVREVEGHSYEIVDLAFYTVRNDEGRQEQYLLSASLDGTLRRWKWPDVTVESAPKTIFVPVPSEEEQKESMMTEDEERELAELMDDE